MTTTPDWADVDHWRDRQREAMGTREGRAAVLRDWVIAAGGTVNQEGHLETPPNLLRCLALAELHALARGLGFLR